MTVHTDVVVLGSGVAGLSFALRAAQFCRVVVLTKDKPEESNSRYAQGGIAAVWSEDDNYQNHIEDTLVAGAGLCRPDAVELTVREGPDRVRDLIAWGARFTRDHEDASRYDLHREGGHSHRRILHADDLTGAELVRALTKAAEEEPNITMLDHHMGINLVTRHRLARRQQRVPPADDRVLGCYVLNQHTGEVEVFASRFVVLATGGAGQLYQFTTNPTIATGDGMAMAYRAGARMANMEFVQFHPTCLHHERIKGFLISEALRGEGGRLVHANGQRFMAAYDDRMELAPRDVVARAIDAELKRRGLDCVFLDMTHLPEEDLKSKFPNIYATLQEGGIDMARDPIPVVPAAHYFCGGVQTDLEGRTSVPGLFAVGEAACTGLHGANRLASNSLLEALVFAEKAADVIKAGLAQSPDPVSLPPWEVGAAVDSDELVVLKQVSAEVRSFMWNYVGIVRTHRRMQRARRRIALVREEIESYYWDFKITGELVELRNLITVAELVVQSALRRRESRGLHTTREYPEADPRFLRDTVIERQF
ncbi:MAG: L-aspartate oxidase [Myxococcota bacterium]